MALLALAHIGHGDQEGEDLFGIGKRDQQVRAHFAGLGRRNPRERLARAFDRRARLAPIVRAVTGPFAEIGILPLEQPRAVAADIGKPHIRTLCGGAARRERMDAPDRQAQRDGPETSGQIDGQQPRDIRRVAHRMIDHHDAGRRRQDRDLRGSPVPRCDRARRRPRTPAPRAPRPRRRVPRPRPARPPQTDESKANPAIDAKRMRFEPPASARQVQNAPIAAHAKSGRCSMSPRASMLVAAQAARSPSARLVSCSENDTIQTGR